MTEHTHSQKSQKAARAAAGFAGVFALALLTTMPAARAQQASASATSAQTTAGTATVRQDITRFADTYGTPIIQRGRIDGTAQAALTLGGDGAVRTREADIAALANAAGAQWHRMFFVAPATADKPATTLADAKNLTTDSGRISLQIKGLPLRAAARAFASATDSEVKLTDDLTAQPGGTVTIPAANLTAAQVVARMAAQTKTHWTVGYVLEPVPGGSATLASSQGASGQTDASGANQAVSYTPYQGNGLGADLYAQVANAIPDGYDQYGNPYFYAPAQSGGYGNGSDQTAYAQNPYAVNGGYASNSYPGYYGYPGADAGGFTTTSPTYYGYGYGPSTNPYAAGATQNATPVTGEVGSGIGYAPYNSTVFSSGGIGSGSGSATLTP